MTELATYEHDGAIGQITLDDGKVNAFSIAMLRVDPTRRSTRPTGRLRARDPHRARGPLLRRLRSGRPSSRATRAAGPRDARAGGAPGRAPARVPPARRRRPAPGHAMAAGAFVLLAADARIGADAPVQASGSTRRRSGSPSRGSCSSWPATACPRRTWIAPSPRRRSTRPETRSRRASWTASSRPSISRPRRVTPPRPSPA